MRRTIVIGDLHGCYAEAMDLLKAVGHTSTDRVVFVGDLVDRGPDSRACVELAMKHESVLGNHELAHLARRHWIDTERPPHHLRTRDSLEPKHWAYLATLPLYLELPEHNAVVVHAGLVPRVALTRQVPSFVVSGQALIPPADGNWRPTGESWWLSKAPTGARFWAEAWADEYTKAPGELPTVIYGHTVVSEPLVLPGSYGIETGCVFGRSLTALVLPEGRLVSVPARSPWWPGRVRETLINGVRVFS